MIKIAQLHRQEIWFPPLEDALDEPNGLLAFGGDLRPERILAAYRQGIFPWYQDGQPILWWSPEPRAVLFPARIEISRSMRKVLRRAAFTISMDRAFEAVIEACAALNDNRTGTWITTPMRRAYTELHRLGHAHSVEVWQQGQLVGGLYGLGLGQVFFGESMFSKVDNASKLALIHLCTQLQKWGFAVLDCQVSSPHLLSMGACEIRRAEFQRLLQQHTEQPCAANGHSWQ